MSEVDALQTALAGEHAAVYGYGVAGAHLDGADLKRATGAVTAHRRRRDHLDELLRDRGAEPVASAATYALPRPVSDAAGAVLLTTELEERLAAVWADAATQLRAGLRRLAAQALQDAAVRAALWRGGSVPFPGLPERSS
ncbi:MAG: ferritin-like domain-containing protein [Actinomycetes bacterium]